MTLDQLQKSITIFGRYMNIMNVTLEAGYDCITVDATGSTTSQFDVQALYDLGWMQDEINHEEGGAFDPEQCWMATV